MSRRTTIFRRFILTTSKLSKFIFIFVFKFLFLSDCIDPRTLSQILNENDIDSLSCRLQCCHVRNVNKYSILFSLSYFISILRLLIIIYIVKIYTTNISALLITILESRIHHNNYISSKHLITKRFSYSVQVIRYIS